MPTEELIKSLQPAKSIETNPLRPSVEESTKIVSKPVNMQTPISTAYPSYYMPPYGYYPHLPPPTPLPYIPTQTQAPDPVPHQQIDVRSSSALSEVDFIERLVQYLSWLSKHSPQQSTLFSEAKDALLLAGHTFETVGLLTDEKLANLSIVEAIALQIRTKLAKFKRAQASGRV